FFGRVFPPPTTGALVLAGQHGAGAGLAANADHPALVQRVIGDLEGADRVPELGGAERSERVDLVERSAVAPGKARVALEHRDRRASGGALIATLAGDPGPHAAKLPTQGLDLADPTALLVAVLEE